MCVRCYEKLESPTVLLLVEMDSPTVLLLVQLAVGPCECPISHRTARARRVFVTSVLKVSRSG